MKENDEMFELLNKSFGSSPKGSSISMLTYSRPIKPNVVKNTTNITWTGSVIVRMRANG